MANDETKPSKNGTPDAEKASPKETPPEHLRPIREVLVATEYGPVSIPAQKITADLVGWKAFGLASLPPEWVPKFFVVDGNCSEPINQRGFESAISQCLTQQSMAERTVYRPFQRGRGNYGRSRTLSFSNVTR